MRLRRFNDAGVDAFRAYLDACRLDPRLAPPMELLEDAALTERTTPAIDVEPQTFKTKGDAAAYLADRLKSLTEKTIDLDVGLWAWLTLFYFESIVPPTRGRRTVKGEYYYILDAADSRYVYRHLLRIAWRTLKIAPKHNRLMLSTSLSTLDKVTERTMSRLYLSRIPCFFEVLDRLYWDPATQRSKPGIVNQTNVRGGDLAHRLPLRIRQLEKTFDLPSLTADELLALLGAEFEPWLASSR